MLAINKIVHKNLEEEKNILIKKMNPYEVK